MITRRHFVGGLAAAAAAGVTFPRSLFAQDPVTYSDRWGDILPTRPLSRHEDEHVTFAGLGGQHYRKLDPSLYEPAIEAAMAGGVRFYDTATNYGRDQQSEKLYGTHLTPKYRDEIFLMTKSASRNAEGAKRDLDRSLANMKTDRIDLWQIHTLESVEDVENRFNNGVIDVFLEAKAAGKARYIGFTGHKDYRAHLRMLELLKEKGVDLDACQMPINVVDPHYDSFIVNVFPILQERGYGVLAMKTMVGGRLHGGQGEFGPRVGADIGGQIIPEKMSFFEATHYVWSLPIATRIFGYNDLDQLNENIAAAKAYTGLTEEKQQELLGSTVPQSGAKIEFYKRNYDAPDERF